MAALVITAASVVQVSGKKPRQAIASVAVTAGQAVTITDDEVVLATNTSSPEEGPYLAVNNAAAGQHAAYVEEDSVVDLGLSLTPGTMYFVGTAGGIIPEVDLVATNVKTLLGYINTDGNLVLTPIITEVVL